MELRFRLPARPNARVFTRLFLFPAVAVLLVLTTGWLIERLDAERFRQTERASVLSALSTIRARVEGTFNGSILLIRGLVAEIALNPDIDQARFARIARELMAQGSLVRNIAAARDLVITHMYPVAGNEAAIGFDYRKHPAQREAVLRVRDSGKIVVAGPVDMVQGGRGFIGRVPVFLSVDDEEKPKPFWGLAATVIDAEALYREAGLFDPDLPLQIAIRGHDGLGAAGDVFFGDPAIFDADSVLLDVSLTGGSWQLAALPKGGWSSTAPSAWPIRVMVPGIAVLVGVLVLLRVLAQVQREAVEHKLRRLVAELNVNKQAIDASPDGIAIVDRDFRFLQANRACTVSQGMTPQQVIGRSIAEFIGEDVFATLIRAKLERCLAGEVVEFDAWFSYKSLGRRFMHVRYTPIMPDGGEICCVVAVLHDITERHQAELERERAEAARRRSEEQLIDAIESIHEGFVLWDKDDRMVLCNSRYCEFFPSIAHHCRPGVTFEELIRISAAGGETLFKGSMEDWIQARLASHRSEQHGFKEHLVSGRWIYITEMKTAAGGLVGIYSDVTELKKAEEDVRFRAYFDPLTELPNRMNFIDHLAEALARNQRSRSRLALMFIDLDRFKNVNDTLGHMVGDELLKEAALRIRACVRNTDTVARLGGDEFTVILSDLSDDIQATRAAEAIIERLAQPYQLCGHEVTVGASIGITLCPADGTDSDTLLKNADMAMYRAKESGRNTFRYFTGEMSKRAKELVALEKDLHRAIENEEFVVFYQPIVELSTAKLASVEALARWRHPTRGLVMPGEFIRVAEDTGLIGELGMAVLRTACLESAAALENATTDFPCLTVNVSSRQFKTGFDGKTVEKILAETGYPADRLIFEITESLLMDEDERVHQAFYDFHDMGILLSLDDFGTGYSSLGYLRQFPVEILKIDRSFVRDIAVEPDDQQLVEAIITMGHSLGLRVIAEGVERPEQAALLQSLQCDMAQGYLFGQPAPVPALTAVDVNPDKVQHL